MIEKGTRVSVVAFGHEAHKGTVEAVDYRSRVALVRLDDGTRVDRHPADDRLAVGDDDETLAALLAQHLLRDSVR